MKVRVDPRPATPAQGDGRLKAQLTLASFLMLFVELGLIRWTAEQNVYLALFANVILLASFLGIGLGFLRARRATSLFGWAPLALAGLIGFCLMFPIYFSGATEVQLYYSRPGIPVLPKWLSLGVTFLGSVLVMEMIAEGVARRFIRLRPLDAYRLDIAGSIGGIVAFSLLALFRAEPWVWGLIAAVAFLPLLGPRARGAWQALGLAAAVGLLVFQSLNPSDHWSPYYRIQVTGPDSHGLIHVSANGIPHQAIRPMAQLTAPGSVYPLPYSHLRDNPLRNVLIIGAGTGNDVTMALAKGARHVDAVEIDPELYDLGVSLNGSRPYQNPHVSIHINDGRAFLEQTSRHYDLILFALPDSLTLVSQQGGIRLESYLLTEQAVQAARAHLTPGGSFAMYNYYQPFEFERLGRTLTDVFGERPCVDFGHERGERREAVLADGNTRRALACQDRWSPAGHFVPAPATDNWPFPYLPVPSIPAVYLWSLVAMLGLSLLLVRGVGGPLGAMGAYTDLFFMGVAFMLLETKNVVQFALLFGTTWFVNALVFAGILLSVYAAVETARHVRFRRPLLLYPLLIATIAIAWAVPQDALLSLGVVPRFVAATALAFAPVYLANLVFAARFRGVGSLGVAFAANLLGAMVGGALEYVSMITGYRALLVLVACFYGLAFLTGRRYLTGAKEPSYRRGPRRLRLPRRAGP